MIRSGTRLPSVCVAALVMLMAGSCSSDTSSSSSNPASSGTVSGVGNNCVDEPGTLSGTLQDWYSEVYNGQSGFDASLEPAVSDRGTEFAASVTQAVADQLPAFEPAGVGELVDFDGTCLSVRWVTLDRADGASISITVWRPAQLGQRVGVPMAMSPSSPDERTMVSESTNFTAALTVADDGTTVRVVAYGAFQQERMGGWPTTTTAPANMPPPGPTPATAEQAAAIAASVLAAALAR